MSVRHPGLLGSAFRSGASGSISMTVAFGTYAALVLHVVDVVRRVLPLRWLLNTFVLSHVTVGMCCRNESNLRGKRILCAG